MQTIYFNKYSRPIRYILFIFSLIFLVFTIKVVLNLSEIDKRIYQIKNENLDFQEKDSFMKYYYESYLSGNYIKFFRSHENSTIFSGEKIVKFSQSENMEMIEESQEIEKIREKEKVLDITKPKDSWDYFIKDKWEKFKLEF